MALYYPAQTSRPVPLVLLPLAYPEPAAHVRAFGPHTSWAQPGMAAVVYGTEVPQEDVHAMLRHLRGNATDLRIDVDQFGIWAPSGNVTVGLSMLMRDERIRCGVFWCGYTMDTGDSTAWLGLRRLSNASTKILSNHSCVVANGISIESVADGSHNRVDRD